MERKRKNRFIVVEQISEQLTTNSNTLTTLINSNTSQEMRQRFLAPLPKMRHNECGRVVEEFKCHRISIRQRHWGREEEPFLISTWAEGPWLSALSFVTFKNGKKKTSKNVKFAGIWGKDGGSIRTQVSSLWYFWWIVVLVWKEDGFSSKTKANMKATVKLIC